jgi:lipoprotein-anchoring transpeptidase ErfK/SrfK
MRPKENGPARRKLLPECYCDFRPNGSRNYHEKDEVMTLVPFVTRHRGIAAAALAVAVAAAVAAGLLLPGGGAVRPRPVPRAPRALPARHTAPEQPAGVTTVATLRVAAPRYAASGGKRTGVVATSWYDRVSVLPVITTRPGWVEVRLPQRPNGSTAWVPAGDVTLGSTPYEIVIDLETLHLSLYDYGRLVFSAPAGVGTPDDPTPKGEYFVAFDEPPPEPGVGYGPFVLVTSAHSPAISDWEGSGDAVIGIHGPLGMDAEIGIKGARISHGCVRLHVAALEKLSGVPPGTPIDITG